MYYMLVPFVVQQPIGIFPVCDICGCVEMVHMLQPHQHGNDLYLVCCSSQCVYCGWTVYLVCAAAQVRDVA